MKIDRRQTATVRAEVRRLLERTPAYRELPPEQRKRLARDMVRVAASVASADDPQAAAADLQRALHRPAKRPHATARLVKSVDFPKFVAGLIQGVFQSVVDASIQQMNAYAELLGRVSATLPDFLDDDDDD